MTATTIAPPARDGVLRTVGRVWLGLTLAFAGTTHLTVARQEFLAQVPAWVPVDHDLVVLASGAVEIALGIALVGAPRRWRPWVGAVVALFFVAIFPGNVAQYVEGVDGFGLDTDAKRLARLPFQAVLVLWALWSCGTWRAYRAHRAATQTADAR
ncbi:DoxX family protein [Cellulomonas fimi]|uniref:DoxX family protein n=1 Tax=Cellulomonas fimi (strain ATCC 484 / DSM 20113 / JCM 1341 / CCUG 24087 / LMG 16345 / NBRC 15513 / NCIMB 8980 / NCTC 7547 / NRS-133) TaxID=590998 RepID=F4H7J4_CELFA|nr:hypothetical protein [Cellulomonas fimi]AEE44551.1 hypothetical protein Celf_0408 [Cellulomonas fimi ATCC 484]NNH06473.1 hypothetical protein [Cellulomonas fimi]VEH26597.1 Predicted membrane protein [Cellulomonas fimi]